LQSDISRAIARRCSSNKQGAVGSTWLSRFDNHTGTVYKGFIIAAVKNEHGDEESTGYDRQNYGRKLQINKGLSLTRSVP
jgi:hypothetical protein